MQLELTCDDLATLLDASLPDGLESVGCESASDQLRLRLRVYPARLDARAARLLADDASLDVALVLAPSLDERHRLRLDLRELDVDAAGLPLLARLPARPGLIKRILFKRLAAHPAVDADRVSGRICLDLMQALPAAEHGLAVTPTALRATARGLVFEAALQ